MSRRNDIINISVKISDCRDQLKTLGRRLDVLIGETDDTTGEEQQAKEVNGNTTSYGETILEILGSDQERVFTEDELLESASISEDKKASFRSALSRLVKRGKISKPYTKHYRAN